ncbi:peroxiredoxin family protein [Mangrovibacterium sp.]|uniref:peroxiredoxin family protein n=1 Tax=Mangrovibacterium sp. TaxID=1961364 RepID=UPI003568AF57
MIRFLSIVLLFALFLNTKAQTQPVKISGIAPGYAGKSIDLLVQTDPITDRTSTVATIQVLADGTFDTSVPVKQTSFCFATFDRWKAELYLQPGANYHLLLPGYQPLTEAEKRNPFLQPIEIPFGLRDAEKNDINELIRSFEAAYVREEANYFGQIFKDKSHAAADSMTARLVRQFPKTKNGYFEDYKFYRLATIRFALNQDNANEFIKTYLDRQPLPFNLPPYTQLFEQQFTGFFYQESNRIGGDQFRNMVGKGNLAEIENYLTGQKKWSPALSRMVILKGIADGYYQGQFNPKTMLSLLEKIAGSNWNAQEKEVAKALQHKLTYLTAGTAAPTISGADLNGQSFKLSDLRGKLVVLHFSSVTNPICRQHLDELKNIADQFKGKVEFINLLPMADLAKKALITQQNWPGRFILVDDQQLEKYRIKTFPISYLVDEQGNLLYAPALNPTEGLSRQLSGLMKQRQIEKFRNQAK